VKANHQQHVPDLEQFPPEYQHLQLLSSKASQLSPACHSLLSWIIWDSVASIILLRIPTTWHEPPTYYDRHCVLKQDGKTERREH
jgi:hypothetical protein